MKKLLVLFVLGFGICSDSHANEPDLYQIDIHSSSKNIEVQMGNCLSQQTYNLNGESALTLIKVTIWKCKSPDTEIITGCNLETTFATKSFHPYIHNDDNDLCRYFEGLLGKAPPVNKKRVLYIQGNQFAIDVTENN